MIAIREAQPNEAPFLTELAFSSKASWGYSSEFMEACRDDLIVPAESCEGGHVAVATIDEKIVGFYRLSGDAPEGELSDLFIAPEYQRQGVGRELIAAAIDQSRRLGFKTLDIHSDPYAEDFYLKIGAIRIGGTPSDSIPGRVLPLLRLDV